MNMAKVTQRVGYAVAGAVTVAVACAPMSVELEHRSANGEAGEGASGTGSDATGSAGIGGTSASGGRDATGGVGATGQACGIHTFALSVNGHDMVPGYVRDPAVLARVQQMLSAMTTEEKLGQMQGVDGELVEDYNDISRQSDFPTVRGIRYRDGGRGVNLSAGQDNRPTDGFDYSTVFPTESLRAASWDLDLEWRIGEALGDEVAGTLNNLLIAPNMNIVRHPFWGRTQETYGEDMHLIGRMASALTAGIQQHVIACAGRFAANNVENLRKNQDARMDEQTLREIYGRHFEMVVKDGGVGCVVAAYNKINGVKSTQNGHLLTDILRDDFGFKGFVISDWWAMPGDLAARDLHNDQRPGPAKEAVEAGLDIEMPWQIFFGTLPEQVASGAVDVARIDQAAARILEQKIRFNTMAPTDPWGLGGTTTVLGADAAGPASVNHAAHRALAEEAAVASAVLLKNGPADGSNPTLPLTDKAKLAVVGIDYSYELRTSTCPNGDPGKSGCSTNLATEANLGDRGSSRVNADPAATVSVFAGMDTFGRLHGAENVVAVTGDAATAAAEAAATDADAYVVVVGLTANDEGEEYAIVSGGDRSSLGFPKGQEGLVSAVLDLGKPTVVIVESGSIMNLPWLAHANQQQATIWAGYPGMNGGAALARLVFAHEGANFSGKMPLAWPTEDMLPPFETDPASKRTEMGYFFGYRHYDREGVSNELVFPFGHGLSYTTFEYSNLAVSCPDASRDSIVDVTVDIRNVGAVPGDEIAMLFVAPPPKGDDDVGERPVKELKAFVKEKGIQPGEVRTATMPLRVSDLRRWKPEGMNPNSPNGSWIIDEGDYTLMLGKNAADADTTALQTTVHVND